MAKAPATSKYKSPKPELDEDSTKDAVKWAATELGAEKANKKEIEAFLKDAYGKEIPVGGRTVGIVRAELGFSALSPAGSAASAPTGTATRSQKASTGSASTTDVVNVVVMLQTLLRDHEYEDLKSIIEDVSGMVEKLGSKAEVLKLLKALAGQSEA